MDGRGTLDFCHKERWDLNEFKGRETNMKDKKTKYVCFVTINQQVCLKGIFPGWEGEFTLQ